MTLWNCRCTVYTRLLLLLLITILIILGLLVFSIKWWQILYLSCQTQIPYFSPTHHTLAWSPVSLIKHQFYHILKKIWEKRKKIKQGRNGWVPCMWSYRCISYVKTIITFVNSMDLAFVFILTLSISNEDFCCFQKQRSTQGSLLHM